MPLPLWISSLFAGGIEEALGTAALRVGSRAWNTKQIATTMNKVIGGWGGGSASDMVRAGLSKTGNLPRAEMLTGDAANLTSSKLVTSWIGTAQRRADPKIILGKKGGWSTEDLAERTSRWKKLQGLAKSEESGKGGLGAAGAIAGGMGDPMATILGSFAKTPIGKFGTSLGYNALRGLGRQAFGSTGAAALEAGYQTFQGGGGAGSSTRSNNMGTGGGSGGVDMGEAVAILKDIRNLLGQRNMRY